MARDYSAVAKDSATTTTVAESHHARLSNCTKYGFAVRANLSWMGLKIGGLVSELKVVQS